MTLVLDLTQEEEDILRAKAARRGMDEVSYLKSLIHGKRVTSPASKTPAELVAEWQANGLLTGYGDPTKDSPEVAAELREQLSQREPSH